jgi:hypothetical protein
MANGFRASVPRIPGRPSPHGLLGGCTEVITVSDVHELNGTNLMPSACGAGDPWTNCPPPEQPNPASKIFDPTVTCSFDPVTVYAGVRCATFGLTHEESQALALERLELGEQAGLEDWFMRNWLCTNAEDLTPVAGALSIAQGVGVLENWLALNYGGLGVLHVPAGAAALMSRFRVVPCCDPPIQTLMGNCVVLGAGYSANVGPADPGPGCAVAPSGEAWLYITPPVRVRRDERSSVIRTEAQAVDTRLNDRYALAETTFVVEVACCDAAAVRVTLTDCP